MSNFESKTSLAAKMLKGRMGLPESEVAPEDSYGAGPPPGSYAAQARDRQVAQRQAEQQAQAEELARVPQIANNGEPPAQLPEVAVADGGQPPQHPGPLEGDPALSQRAKARIEELARERREFERQASEAGVERERLAKQNQELEQRLDRLQQEFQAMLQANLDHLDPEARTRVMTEASARHAAAATRQELLKEMQPILDEIKANQFQMALASLASKYPAFDYETHADKLAAVLRANPALSIEQAFRAIATDEELGTTSSRPVPPVLPPRGSRGSETVAPPPRKDPDLDLKEERDEWRRLAHSGDPTDKKRADQMLQQHLKNRLGMK